MASDPVFSLYELDTAITREQMLDAFARVPARVAELTSAASPAVLARRGAGDEWSALEVIRHLRDASLVYGIRFRWIVFDEDPLLPNYDENHWVRAAHDGVEDIPAIVEEFAAARRGLMRMLRALDDGGWARTGRHEVIGPVVLEPYVRHQLAHEEMHLRQLAEALTG